MTKLTVKGQAYTLPLYLPDATSGVVRGLDSSDLQKVGIQGLVVNTYHLMIQPGIETLQKLGGIKTLMNWPGLIASDSGGFQIFSLIHRRQNPGKITDEGILFQLKKPAGVEKIKFTPEKSIQTQFALGAELMICLDDFTPANASSQQEKETARRTVNWALRCKEEFENQLKNHHFTSASRPLLLAVIQGGRNKKTRAWCAQKLLEIGFDGFGLGGWLHDEKGRLDLDIVKLNADSTPPHLLRFALGVGDPAWVWQLFTLGYHLFDCVLPTRDGRHGRLYLLAPSLAQLNPQTPVPNKKKIFRHLYIQRGAFQKDPRPLDPACACPTCQNHSRAYLHHLFKIKDPLAGRLATLHNLFTYTRLTQILQKSERESP